MYPIFFVVRTVLKEPYKGNVALALTPPDKNRRGKDCPIPTRVHVQHFAEFHAYGNEYKGIKIKSCFLMKINYFNLMKNNSIFPNINIYWSYRYFIIIKCSIHYNVI